MVFLIFLGLILIIISLLCFIFLLDLVILGHDVNSNREAQNIVYRIIEQNSLQDKTFYDLGCARGTFSLNLKKRFPKLNVYASDNNFLRISLAKLKNKFFKRGVNFSRANIFNLDLSKTDIIFTYLWYSTMPPLEKKLLAELKPGAIVIANESYFPTWRPQKVVDTLPNKKNSVQIFIYKKSND